MAKIAGLRIEVSSDAVVAILNSPEVAGDLARRGAAIQGALPTDGGEEWGSSQFTTDRANVTVYTMNKAAKLAAAEDLALIRALDAGR